MTTTTTTDTRQLLDQLVQTAACLPPTLVVRAHRDMASSLNLALVYVGGDQLPSMSSTTTRWDGY